MRISAASVPICLLLLCLSGAPAQALLCGSGLPLASNLSVSATALNFGSYSPAAGRFANATVRVECGLLGIDLLPGFTVSLTAQNSADPAARRMLRAAVPLTYNLYTGNDYGTVWGDGSNASVMQSYNPLLALGAVNFTAWGRLPAGQYVPAGSYTDVITVTVAF